MTRKWDSDLVLDAVPDQTITFWILFARTIAEPFLIK